uniref:Tc1-like transposase DDE domain-containing protein n=1 Tax=Cyprinodon variegatus TaxID=28743 RepID=A0A3Q2D6V6_CYPVA
MGKKGDLSNFERGSIVGARRSGLSISKTAELLGFSRTTISRVYREWSEKNKISSKRQSCGRKSLVDVRGQMKMGRLIQDDKKATVAEITTRYNQDVQNTISERTARRTLKQMGYSGRRPHRTPILSANNRRLRLQFAQAHRSWSVGEWKNVAWSSETRFQLQRSNGRVKIWHEQEESLDPSPLGTQAQPAAMGLTVWGIFSWHKLGSLVSIDDSLNAADYLRLVADHVLPFMTTVYPSADGCFQQGNAPFHKDEVVSSWFQEHKNQFSVLHWPPQSPDLNPIERLWDVIEREIRVMDGQPTNLQQLREAVMSGWSRISEECFRHAVESMPQRIEAVLKANGGPTRY